MQPILQKKKLRPRQVKRFVDSLLLDNGRGQTRTGSTRAHHASLDCKDPTNTTSLFPRDGILQTPVKGKPSNPFLSSLFHNSNSVLQDDACGGNLGKESPSKAKLFWVGVLMFL